MTIVARLNCGRDRSRPRRTKRPTQWAGPSVKESLLSPLGDRPAVRGANRSMDPSTSEGELLAQMGARAPDGGQRRYCPPSSKR